MPETVMQSLTLNDGAPHTRYSTHYPARERRYRSPRLPTPETSRSSREMFDSPRSIGLTTRDILMRSSSGERNTSLGIPHGAAHSRRDSRNTSAPHSPPYVNGEVQKPSLPPLKMILGDNITSPPRTPSPGQSPMQLGPREPSYTTATFKPPALYPNKKQKIEPTLNSAPPFPGRNSAFPPSSAIEPRTSNSSITPHFPSMDSIDSRRANMQPAPTSHAGNSPSWGTQYPPPNSISSRSSAETSASSYQNPEQALPSTMLQPSMPRVNPFSAPAQDPFAREMRDSFAHPAERPSSRRSSTSGYGVFAPRGSDREPLRPSPFQPGARYTPPLRESYSESRDSIRYMRPEEHHHRQAIFPPHSYQSNVPAFFMPSHYEYQHGKARKRSNLPKQSTEIMKTWFDQNIANPYPSEEQKAIFSNATGISMTQVSNWFINHRRRCPELRDKREKSRGGSRDCDS